MIERRTFSAALSAGAATALLGVRSTARAADSIRNVVLVPGLYADGSSWVDVIRRLQSADIRATAVQNPLRSFDDDVASARRILDMQDGPTVLVAHSYGGMVVSQAGVHPKVSTRPEYVVSYMRFNRRILRRSLPRQKRRLPLGVRNPPGTRCRSEIARSIRILSVSWRHA
jgi:pimeloyl-ACP methyl ester carboxylesterase